MTHLFAKKLRNAGAHVTEEILDGQTHNYFIARAVMGDGKDPSEYLAQLFSHKAKGLSRL